MSVKVGVFQAIGLVGLALVVVGGTVSLVLPQVGPTVVTFDAGVPLFLIGGFVLWVGILGAWVQGIARATRAWDDARKEYSVRPK